MAKAAKLHEIAIDQLIPYDKNAKTHSPEQVEKLAASIREFGFVSPILIDEQNQIIAGHGRVLAAKALGMKKIPAVNVEGLTEAQRRAYIIADNRLTELGGWDMETVRAELEELQADGFDTEITGFGLSDISFTEDMAPEISEEELGELEEKAPARVKEGDVWQLGDHRLMCGDSTDAKSVEKLMGGVWQTFS